MELAEKQATNQYNEKPLLRNQMITECLPYVKSIVHRIAIHLPPNVEFDDLMSAGVIGLIQAAERYDPKKNTNFITYASFRIKGSVLSELRSRDFFQGQIERKFVS